VRGVNFTKKLFHTVENSEDIFEKKTVRAGNPAEFQQ
jgi:hypothetical protein